MIIKHIKFFILNIILKEKKTGQLHGTKIIKVDFL